MFRHSVTSSVSNQYLPGHHLAQVDETTLEIEVSEGQMLSDALCVLNDAGIRIRSMRNKTNRLEELFLRITDKQQRNGETTRV